MRGETLSSAIREWGGPAKLGRELGISGAAVSQWDQVPPLRVLDVEQLTGIPRHRLRPDMYPPPVKAKAGAGA